MAAGITDEVYSEYLKGLLAGDRRSCARIMLGLLKGGTHVRVAYSGLFQRSLCDVGALWERSRISVATEHIATAITEGLLNLALPFVLDADPVGRTAIVASVSPELHQVGAKIVADVFEMHGWDSLFVGANAPREELLRLVRETEPDLVALSLTMVFNVGALEDLIVALRARWSEVEIVVGGQGLARGGPALVARHPGVAYLPSLDELEASLG